MSVGPDPGHVEETCVYTVMLNVCNVHVVWHDMYDVERAACLLAVQTIIQDTVLKQTMFNAFFRMTIHTSHNKLYTPWLCLQSVVLRQWLSELFVVYKNIKTALSYGVKSPPFYNHAGELLLKGFNRSVGSSFSWSLTWQPTALCRTSVFWHHSASWTHDTNTMPRCAWSPTTSFDNVNEPLLAYLQNYIHRITFIQHLELRLTEERPNIWSHV